MATTQAIFKQTKDAGQPLDVTVQLEPTDLIAWEVPETGGPFVTGDPQSNTLSGEVLLRPLATIAADSLSDPMTAANLLLFKEVSEGGTAAAQYDETSVAEYKVQWGGTAGGTNASSSSPFFAPDDTITLDHDGDYTFDVLPYQKTFSQENGTATGGIFYLKTSTGSTIESLTFPWKKRDSNYTNFPYEGGRQTIFRENMSAGTYRLGFTSHAGSGSGNRVSYEGYAHVIVRRTSLLTAAGPSEPIEYLTGDGDERLTGDSAFGKPIWARDFMRTLNLGVNSETQILSASQIDKFIGVAFGTIGTHGRGNGVAWGSTDIVSGTIRTPEIYQHSGNNTLRFFTEESLSNRRFDLVLLYTKP